MSTVALRGTLAYDETAKEWSWSGRWLFGDCVPVPEPGSEETPGPSPTSKKHHAKKKAISQPFLYKWQEASRPSEIPVPSLNVKIIGEEEGESEPQATPVTSAEPISATEVPLDKDSNNESQQKPLPTADESKTEKQSTSVTDDKAKTADMNTTGESKVPEASADTLEKTEASKVPASAPTPATPATPMDPKSSSDKSASDETKLVDKPKDDKEPVPTEATAESVSKDVSAPSESEETEKKIQKDGLDKDKNSESLSVAQQSKESVENTAPTNQADATKKEDSKPTEIASKESKPEGPAPMDIEQSIDSKPEETKPEAPPKICFDFLLPKFLNAADKYNSNNNYKCPPSGQWKGYFENVIPGKKTARNKPPAPPTIQKVDETFHLLLNATPSSKEDPEPNSENPSADLFAFETATKDHIPKITVKKDEGAKDGEKEQMTAESDPKEDNTNNIKQPVSLVQVRGCGENEFGTFEIMGYLDLNTMVMEIQRQYVVTEMPAVSTPAVTRRRRSSATAGSLQEGTRSHSTRKRNPTWKRASYDPEEDRRRKRARPMSGNKDGSPMSVDGSPAVDANGNPIPGSVPFTINPDQVSSEVLLGKFDASAMSVSGSVSSLSTSVGGRSQKSRLVLPTHSKGPGIRRSSSTGAIRTKRRSSGMGKSGTSAASTKSSSTHIRLPAVGDPKKARWRAAHFLYYQRDDPEQRAQQLQQQEQQSQPGSTANSTGANATTSSAKLPPPKPKYVIYEGEMVDSKREGRGICLFSDGTLYEGEWKRDKEHGYGKLMSSDRKQIIYEGEWERGRMQGNGTYYYGSSDPVKPGSRYIGEFRENLRNGMGRYFLADGSVYDGQWRDGVMNGLGIFTWPDLSMYDGVWKDGKRNGQGLLKKADGFIYDGQWVNNTMEGRGIAIYPNGQKYEGSFSNGRREGRGTIVFTNGAVYEGRFRDDAVDGQGTMKMSRTMIVPREDKDDKDTKKEEKKDGETEEVEKEDFMIPISFQSDMTRILTKTGFM